MAYGINQKMVNPFLIGNNSNPAYPPSNILEMALMGNNSATVDDKIKALQQNQFNSLVDEDINKNITDPNVLQQIENAVGNTSEEVADNSMMDNIKNAIIPSAEASTINNNKKDIDYQAKAKEYAQWILNNKDKQGTKEFDTIVRAYEVAKSRIDKKTGMLDAVQASVTKLLPAQIAGGFQAGVDMALDKFGDNMDMDTRQILYGLSNQVGSFQDELMAEVTEVYKGRPNDIPASVLQGIQAGDYSGAVQALGYGVAEGIGTSVPSFVAGLVKRYPAVAVIASSQNGLMLLNEKRQEKIDKGLDPNLSAQDILVVAGQMGLDLIPMRKSFMKDMIGEAVIETGQDGATILNTMSQGGEYSTEEINDSLFESFAVGGATQGSMRTASNIGGAVTPNFIKRGLLGGNPNQTAFGESSIDKAENETKTDLANRMQEMARDMGANLKDVDRESQSGARAVLDNTHSELSSLIQANADTIKNFISPKGKNSSTLALDKIVERAKAQSSVSRAKNKVKTTTTDADYQRIRNLAPQTAQREVETLIGLMKESNELSKLQSAGVKGGISRLTDELMPFSRTSQYLPTGVAGFRPILTIGAGIATSGMSTAGQVIGAGGGRFIDSMTGNRSPVRKFVKENVGRSGSRDVSGLPSIQEARSKKIQNEEAGFQRIRQKARSANYNIRRGIDNELNEMGLLPVEQDKGLSILLREGEISQSQYDKFYKNPMSLREDDQGYIAITEGLGLLANQGRINTNFASTQANQQPQPQAQQAQQPQPQQTQQGSPQQSSPTPEQRVSGTENNRRYLDNLASMVEVNESGVTKAVILTALEEFRVLSGRKGTDITQEAYTIYAKAYDVNAVASKKYLLPYVKRVERQQRKNRSKQPLNIIRYNQGQ